ncbi:phosphatidylglycerophosphatase B [Yersinia ruckeri]|uniref:phosphatidylglycerophosphatase B n=1 Tax=Yersinia ruckeri TaxID=29486 RepID=UPI0005AC1FC4|nr:phosphatidylglycerophosphatase B [Yersinia ruckeri]AJI95648.1 phosphatidylglycerophosphatase B [Yersinia ruckeri]MCW6567341.1 phosphatidylglycerophosphatase B [Yersinia ruckeri]
MLDIAKRIIIGTLLLLLMPTAVWISGWHWQPGESAIWLKGFFWLTETVTAPWGIITSMILSAWFLWCLRFRLKPALGLLAILTLAILTGQGVKSLIKQQVQEPRPFVVWLAEKNTLSSEQFYALPRQQRSALIEERMQGQTQVPQWLVEHWQFETGFAFPSGHTVFAVTWALLGVGLLWPRRHYKTIALLMLWATGVMGSRLVLGMHWPQDLIMATLISGLLVGLATTLVQRWIGPLSILPQEQKEIEHRDND